MVHFFKVKIGFGEDDFISIDGRELKKALKAQIEGGVVVFKGGSVSGNNIISITPDWNRVMGYRRGYKLTGEDYEVLGEKRVEEYRNVLENVKTELLEGGNKLAIKN